MSGMFFVVFSILLSWSSNFGWHTEVQGPFEYILTSSNTVVACLDTSNNLVTLGDAC
jgi:hypothetical protein